MDKKKIKKWKELVKSYKKKRIDLGAHYTTLGKDPRRWRFREGLLIQPVEQATIDEIYKFVQDNPNININSIYEHFYNKFGIVKHYLIKECLLILWIRKKIWLRNFATLKFGCFTQRIYLRKKKKRLRRG